LVDEFVRDASERYDRPFPGISPEAMEILKEHSWPGNVRELRNLVESMVVLAPNRPIEPDDIPSEVRSGRGRSLLPAPIVRKSEVAAGARDLRPELEFIFRTLVDLRVDMDDLRRQFEAYRRETALVPMGALMDPREIPVRSLAVEAYAPGTRDDGQPQVHEVEEQPAAESGPATPDADGAVVFRPGMTMEEMEREAIRVALKSVAGNRRKAAELLGIGERTLYRKIAGYGLDV
jgi:DNA-binding NtrC family response regulator